LFFPDDKAASKMFDAGICIGAHFPPIVVEIGVSESYAELKRDAWDWLWGCDATLKHEHKYKPINLVVIVKISRPTSPLAAGSEPQTGWTAFLESWERALNAGMLPIILETIILEANYN
jgi:hypothetical protein